MKLFNVPIIILVVATMVVTSMGDCTTDSFSPCSCTDTASGSNVTCNRVSVSTVQTVFKMVASYNIAQLTLTPSSTDAKIIANVTGNHTISSLVINCPDRSSPLVVDSTAFSLTSLATSSFAVQNCNLSQINWSFLTGFTNLSTFSVSSSSDFHTNFVTFPGSTLTSLSIFSLNSVTGLNGFYNLSKSYKFPSLPPNGLTTFSITNCYDLSDDAIQRLFTFWVTLSSQDTLTSLTISGNSITKVPVDVPKFSLLDTVDMSNNLQAWLIPINSFNFKVPVKSLKLDNSKIYQISGFAFVGDFSDAKVSLYNNQLTSFGPRVWSSMLQQMSASTGYLEVGSNPLKCVEFGCAFAWLLQGFPNYVNSMWTAQCANGTYFFQLNPSTLTCT